jgi:hypothetical protein
VLLDPELLPRLGEKVDCVDHDVASGGDCSGREAEQSIHAVPSEVHGRQ